MGAQNTYCLCREKPTTSAVLSRGESAMDVAPSKDILVSAHSADQQFVGYLKEKFEEAGLSLWYRASSARRGAGKGQAVLDCKIYMPVMSEQSLSDPQFRDEISLAYISNKTIIPLGRLYFRKLQGKMGPGLKLMLAKINWTFFAIGKEDQHDENCERLIMVVKDELKNLGSAVAQPGQIVNEKQAYSALNNHTGMGEDIGFDEAEEVPRPMSRGNTLLGTSLSNCDFWERHFSDTTEVEWSGFKDAFQSDYESLISEHLGEGSSKWLLSLMTKEIFEMKRLITREMYEAFLGEDDGNPDHFFERVKDYAVGSFAMREVFDMESTVRLTAIQQLGSFQTPAVIKQLFDLVEDIDPNIRAVACLALAKTGQRSAKIVGKLVHLLEDEDRVVRESACLSLAHMRASEAVWDIVDLWRNDAIKHVREAAELALQRIGGEEAEKAIKVTNVLAKEMDNLKTH